MVILQNAAMGRMNSREEVIEFISSELCVPKSDLKNETSLSHDLGVAGDDGSEFIEHFCDKFQISYDGFDPVEYFGEEASGNIFLMIFGFFTGYFERNTPRLTVGDLITSVDAGKLVIAK